jgi:hypothetical protein
MAVVIAVSSSQCRGYEGRDEKQGEEISPLEDIKAETTGVERAVLRRFLSELVDSLGYADYCEDSKDSGREGEDCNCVRMTT